MNLKEIAYAIRATSDNTNLTFADMLIRGEDYKELFEPFVPPAQSLSFYGDDAIEYSPDDINWELAWARGFVWEYPDSTLTSIEINFLLHDKSHKNYGHLWFSLYDNYKKVVPVLNIYDFFETGYEGHHMPAIAFGDDLRAKLAGLLEEQLKRSNPEVLTP